MKFQYTFTQRYANYFLNQNIGLSKYSSPRGAQPACTARSIISLLLSFISLYDFPNGFSFPHWIHWFKYHQFYIVPVGHDDHVVGGSPEGVDHGGVAGDHHDAGDDEGDDQLVPSEVDPAHDVKLWALNIYPLTQNSPHCHCSKWQTLCGCSLRNDKWKHPRK